MQPRGQSQRRQGQRRQSQEGQIQEGHGHEGRPKGLSVRSGASAGGTSCQTRAEAPGGAPRRSQVCSAPPLPTRTASERGTPSLLALFVHRTLRTGALLALRTSAPRVCARPDAKLRSRPSPPPPAAPRPAWPVCYARPDAPPSAAPPRPAPRPASCGTCHPRSRVRCFRPRPVSICRLPQRAARPEPPRARTAPPCART
mmetsp:Transcript_45967/g.106003  ORF Transcript_45967/g.106003 Transcript_45967/m.106003 type:complete len:200 (-) Transcript_45967:181-780(-)